MSAFSEHIGQEWELSVNFTVFPECQQGHIHFGKTKHCDELIGDFVFDAQATCDKHLYKDAVVLRGTIEFRDATTHDPLECLPKLNRIFIQDRNKGF